MIIAAQQGELHTIKLLTLWLAWTAEVQFNFFESCRLTPPSVPNIIPNHE